MRDTGLLLKGNKKVSTATHWRGKAFFPLYLQAKLMKDE